MISYAEAIAQCAEHIAAHDSHGYSQPNRKGYGSEQLKFADGTPYAVHRGDYDCSEMARQCAEAAGLLSPDSYMWTGNEDAVLKSAGFEVVPLGEKRRGDILWKTGHTGIYLGDGLMADAHGDERGGIDGPSEGDQTGREIEVRSVWSCSWQRCYRPPEGYIGMQSDISRGIDVSNWQEDGGAEAIRDTACGFAIAKASEGTWFRDPYAGKNADAAAQAGKLFGYYHFANNEPAEKEAEFFVKTCREAGHMEDATLWLDYEAEAVSNGPDWAESFMTRVDELTGKTCGIYMSQSVTVSQEWARSAHRPLWVAQYATDSTVYGWEDDPWSTGVYGAWGGECAIHQYTGDGRVPGYAGSLDLNRGYFTRAEWAAWSGSEDPEEPEEPVSYSTVTFVVAVNVRTEPNTRSRIVAQYGPGESVVISGILISDGYVWGCYVGSESGEPRYVALGETNYIE